MTRSTSCKSELRMLFVLTLTWERYEGRRTVLIALHVTEIECSKFQPAEKCNFFIFSFFFRGVDKVLEPFGLILPAQSQMKLFVGKINPLPSLPPPLPGPAFCEVSVGFWVYWSCMRHTAICVSVSETVTFCAARQNKHTHTHTEEKTPFNHC